MVQSEHQHSTGAHIHRAMSARSPHEAHRTATPLELLFDLVFVVAIAQVAGGPAAEANTR
jgi:low temperature requirement protein LtrA